MKKQLKLFYEISVVYPRVNHDWVARRYRVRPFDLPGRISQLERMVNNGIVCSFMVETLFDFD